ncbi:hypothetical protein RBWH47_01748 [Rhodopirellula baltica WH47]|uniref:Uncharacterized protein n=1 Tax=Rhodopirellula baltica WH47 TaxID=991778 RepID=F2AV93_RHOBT|nr:hypothetical protein RBWH47_01748 [Rhodopirellula baltica WH47]
MRLTRNNRFVDAASNGFTPSSQPRSFRFLINLTVVVSPDPLK